MQAPQLPDEKDVRALTEDMVITLAPRFAAAIAAGEIGYPALALSAIQSLWTRVLGTSESIFLIIDEHTNNNCAELDYLALLRVQYEAHLIQRYIHHVPEMRESRGQDWHDWGRVMLLRSYAAVMKQGGWIEDSFRNLPEFEHGDTKLRKVAEDASARLQNKHGNAGNRRCFGKFPNEIAEELGLAVEFQFMWTQMHGAVHSDGRIHGITLGEAVLMPPDIAIIQACLMVGRATRVYVEALDLELSPNEQHNLDALCGDQMMNPPLDDGPAKGEGEVKA